MTVEHTEGGTIVTGKDISVFRMITLRGALKLEMAGMRRRGRSVYSIVKSEFGLKGSKQKVFEQFDKMVEDAKATAQQGSSDE